MTFGTDDGLFCTGDDVPLSPFCMTNMGEWDKFRNIDMDKQVSLLILFIKSLFIVISPLLLKSILSFSYFCFLKLLLYLKI